MTESQETIELVGELRGHTDWITDITCTANNDKVISSSRDKSINIWKLKRHKYNTGPIRLTVEGKIYKRLRGHNHFVESIDLSSDERFLISGSWDKSVRLWNLDKCVTQRNIKFHKSDILSVSFSNDNRRIVSGSRDNTVIITNTVGKFKKQIKDHTNWVTSVIHSPSIETNHFLSTASHDGTIKCYSLDDDYKLVHSMEAMGIKLKKNMINDITISPDGSLLAAGGKDKTAYLYDLQAGRQLSSLECGNEINALCYSPNRYWLCCCVGNGIKIFDLETKGEVGTLVHDGSNYHAALYKKKKVHLEKATCLKWSSDGKTLYVGYTDGKIRIWKLHTNDY